MAAEPDAIVTPDPMEANHCPHWEQVDWGEKHRRTQATQERVTRVLSDDFGTLTVGDLRRAAEALERHRSPTDYPSQPLSPDVFLRTGMREAIEAEARRRYERERAEIWPRQWTAAEFEAIREQEREHFRRAQERQRILDRERSRTGAITLDELCYLSDRLPPVGNHRPGDRVRMPRNLPEPRRLRPEDLPVVIEYVDFELKPYNDGRSCRWVYTGQVVIN